MHILLFSNFNKKFDVFFIDQTGSMVHGKFNDGIDYSNYFHFYKVLFL